MAGSILFVDLYNPEQEVVLTASSLLKEGKIIVYPSDTVYGILADGSNKQAVESVTQVKGYTEHRPFIVLVKDIKGAMQLACMEKIGKLEEAKEFLENSNTVILPASSKAPKHAVSTFGTIALRVPQDPLSLGILNYSSLNLISTSANIKTELFPLSVKQIPEQILSRVALVINAGSLVNRTPSQIFDLTGNTPKQLR